MEMETWKGRGRGGGRGREGEKGRFLILDAKSQSGWTYSTPNAPFNDCFDKVMSAFIHKFAGPPDTGVPSPSAQETGYNMCMAAVEDCAPHLLDISIETPNLHYMPLSSHSVPEHSESISAPQSCRCVALVAS